MIRRSRAAHDQESGLGGIDPFGGPMSPAPAKQAPVSRPPARGPGAGAPRGSAPGRPNVPMPHPGPGVRSAHRGPGIRVGGPGPAFPAAESSGETSGAPRRRISPVALAVPVAVVLLLGGAAFLFPRVLPARHTPVAAAAASIDYQVPADWTRAPSAPGSSAGGITLDGVATAGGYTCQGHRHSRATVGRTFVVRGDGADARTEDAARDFGPMFATSFYGAAVTAPAGAPTPITIGGVTGSTATVRITPRVPVTGCATPTGEVTVVALPTDRHGVSGLPGVLLLVLQHDTGDGPASPAAVDTVTTAGVMGSLRLVDR